MSQSVTVQDDIPSSFTASVDRPFEPIGVRELTTQLFDRNNQRLTDEQIQEIITNPQPPNDPDERIKRLSAEANAESQAEFQEEKIYNLSFREIANRTTNTVHNILDDLVNFNPADGVRGFIHIFTISDRLMYVGIIVIAFTLLIMLLKSGEGRKAGGGCAACAGGAGVWHLVKNAGCGGV